MPSHKASPPSPRWHWAIVAIVVAAGIAWVVSPLVRRRGVESAAPALGAPTSAARAPRAARPVAPAARPRATLAGHVRDTGGKPVATASVCAWLLPGHGVTTAQANTPRCVQTDATGAYAIADLLSATPLAVSAGAEGFAPAGYRDPNGDDRVRLGEGEERGGVDFVLRAGVRLLGSVHDATGGAVAHALVSSEDGPARAVATSDAKGEFALWVEPGPVHVEATAPGYAPGWASGPAPGHFFKIHLVPGSTLVGRTVLAGSETAVADVLVEAIQVEGGGARAATRTDADGAFRIDGLMPGRYRVEATSEGREGYSRSSVTLGLGETSSELRVEMDPAYVVRGRVVDKESGEPCRSGQVVITDAKQAEFSQAEIEPDGWARMASVIPGTYRVQVTCQGHLERDDFPTITVKDRDAPPLTWEVERGAEVRLEIVDGQGRAVTKANVWASPNEPGGTARGADQAEKDGTFLLAGLKPGRYDVSVQAQAGGRASQEVTATLGREERVRVELPPAGTIDGIVEDEAHRPVADIRVVASGPGRAVARSLDDGTFSLTGLPSGQYEVRAIERPRLRAAEGRDEPSPVAVTVTAPDRARVTLTIKSRGGTIEGRVIDSAGRPVTDAFLEYARSGGAGVPRYGWGGRAPILTDTDGRFTIDGLGEGDYDLRAQRKGGGEANATQVKTGTRDVALRLAEGASIAGMLSARGAPVERFMVRVRETTTNFQRDELFFHAAGAFALRDLPAGTYRIDAETPLGSATAEVTLAEGEQKSGVALALTMRAEVDGRLVGAEDGAPVAGMMLNVEGESQVALVSGDGSRRTTGADGRFHLEGVLAGSWTLVAIPSDPALAPLRVSIEVPEGGGAIDAGTLRVARRVEPQEP
jgi:protocatechuate 3,4-dioxygenase beta subunit